MAAEQGLTGASAGSQADGAEEFDGRCVWVTDSGVRCRNKARPGSYYCGVHEKEAAAE